MKEIPDGSVDMILCDLPYGTTACKWDTVIPMDKLFEQYRRIAKENAAIVLFCAQPFTSALVTSNVKCFKHHWVWLKNRGTGFQCAKYRPMMKTEDIIVFTKNGKRVNYYPQMIPLEKPYVDSGAKSTRGVNPLANFNKFKKVHTEKYPTNVIEVQKVSKPQHPTQKPV